MNVLVIMLWCQLINCSRIKAACNYVLFFQPWQTVTQWKKTPASSCFQVPTPWMATVCVCTDKIQPPSGSLASLHTTTSSVETWLLWMTRYARTRFCVYVYLNVCVNMCSICEVHIWLYYNCSEIDVNVCQTIWRVSERFSGNIQQLDSPTPSIKYSLWRKTFL